MEVTQSKGYLVEDAHTERFGKAFLGVDEEVQSPVLGEFLKDVDDGSFLKGSEELDDVKAVETSVDFYFSLQVFPVLLAQLRNIDLFQSEDLFRPPVLHSVHL